MNVPEDALPKKVDSCIGLAQRKIAEYDINFADTPPIHMGPYTGPGPFRDRPLSDVRTLIAYLRLLCADFSRTASDLKMEEDFVKDQWERHVKEKVVKNKKFLEAMAASTPLLTMGKEALALLEKLKAEEEQ